MKKCLCGIVALAGMVAGVRSQSEVRVLTRPTPPSLEVQNRLQLDVAWRSRVRLQNGRDGLFSVQLIPSKTGPELLVQTLSGAVILFDAETGDQKWRMPLEGAVIAAAGANTQSVFVARSQYLYVLNRKTGLHRVYSKEEGYPEPIVGFRMPASPSAPLTADEDGLFVAMGQRLTAYISPDYERALKGQTKEERDKDKTDSEKNTSLQPIEFWSYYTAAPAIQQAPITTVDQVNVVTSAGNFLAIDRLDTKLYFEFKTQGSVSATMGQHGTIAYVGSDDYNLYALDMHSDKILWRFLSGSPILRKPEVTDRDVFVTAHKQGMSRLVRSTGQPLWLNSRAEQFLAVGPKFVYALDRKGQLLILDALRGTTLATWDAGEWTTSLANEWNDRVYFAAQDGQIMCLHNRELTAPVKNRTFVPVHKEIGQKPNEPKKEEVEKKDEEKIEEKKDEKVKVGEKKIDPKDEKKVDPKDEKKVDAKKVDPKDEKKVDAKKVDPKDEKKVDPKDVKKVDPKDGKKLDPKDEKKVEPKDEKKVDPKDEKKVDPKVEKKVDPKDGKKVDPKDEKVDPKDEKKVDPKDEKKEEKKAAAALDFKWPTELRAPLSLTQWEWRAAWTAPQIGRREHETWLLS